MQIQLVPEKTGFFCFEIVIHERRPPGLFNKKPEDKVTKYEFKCISEAEMVEWMAVLQKNVQFVNVWLRNLIPKGPPLPLFKTQKQIEENVEELMDKQNLQLLDQYPDLKDMQRRSFQGSSTLESPSQATLVGGAMNSRATLPRVKSEQIEISGLDKFPALTS
jgi:hypothetical protein